MDLSDYRGMSDRVRTLAAVSIILGIPLIIIVVVGLILSGRPVVSPVPDENPIQIIILTPAPSPTGMPVQGNGVM
jgi:hypothetical protein